MHAPVEAFSGTLRELAHRPARQRRRSTGCCDHGGLLVRRRTSARCRRFSPRGCCSRTPRRATCFNCASRLTRARAPCDASPRRKTGRRTTMARTETEAPTVRLADYRPPAWLVERVELTFRLAPAATRVTARLAVRAQSRPRRRRPPRPRASTAAASRSSRPRIDGAEVPANALTIDDEGLTVPAAHVPAVGLRLGGRDRDRAGGQHRAGRPLHVARHVLHPVRGRGLPQDHLLPRPPRRDGAVPRAHRGRRAGPALQRQPGRRRAPAGPSGRTRSPSPATSSRWSRASSSPSRTASPPRSGREVAAADLGARRRRGRAAPTPWTR